MARASVRPLPITDYAQLNALGASRSEILQALADGRTGLAPSSVPVPFETMTGAVSAALPELPAELAPWSTRGARMAALLVQQLDDSLRRARTRWRPERIGVILGTSAAGAAATEAAYSEYLRAGKLPDTYDFRRQHTYGAVLSVVARLAGLRGPVWMVSTSCSSSAKSLASAQRLIAADVLDAALVGGIDTLCGLTVHGFQTLSALDRGPCRPFNAGRKGISIGEGAAFLLVEREGEGRALIEGVGESSDAYHMSAPHPGGRGALDAMARALQQAGCVPADVDHVNAHGTGTRLNDAAEASAVRQLLGGEVPVASTKGYTGHALGAAGGIEAVFSIYALEEGWIPPSLHADPVDPELAIHVPNTVTRGRYRRVLSNSFAFGGNNVSLLLRAP